MARYKVEICGVNTANIKVLTSNEMEELFKKMHNGDKSAKEKIAEGNLKLVLSILKNFTHKEENLDDLFQIGCIGLMKAIDNFDLSVGVKFSTYAVPMISGEVKRYLRDNNALRISRSIKDNAYKILRTKEELTSKYGSEPTPEMLSKMLGLEEYEIVEALDSLREPTSIFEPIYNDGGDTIYLCDQIEDKSQRKDLDIKLAIDKALANLTEREQYILDQRFMIGKTQMEVAEEIGISQAQISRLEKNALTRIKRQL